MIPSSFPLRRKSAKRDFPAGCGRKGNEEEEEIYQKSTNKKKGKEICEELQLVMKRFGNNGENSSLGFGEATRSDVKKTLSLFRTICRSLLHEEEEGTSKDGSRIRRVDCAVWNIMKDDNRLINYGYKRLGNVPGVEVGDEYHYRFELFLIGMHHQSKAGIDFMNSGGKILATSIVASGGYDDKMAGSNILIYTGQGGEPNKRKKVVHQKLE